MTEEVAMTPRLWDFGLTPEQGLKIATIMANWAGLIIRSGIYFREHRALKARRMELSWFTPLVLLRKSAVYHLPFPIANGMIGSGASRRWCPLVCSMIGSQIGRASCRENGKYVLVCA